MSKRERFYVGRKNQIPTIFKSSVMPNKHTHSQYGNEFMGPFRTERGARHVLSNPHESFKNVNTAEKAALEAILAGKE